MGSKHRGYLLVDWLDLANAGGEAVQEDYHKLGAFGAVSDYFDADGDRRRRDADRGGAAASAAPAEAPEDGQGGDTDAAAPVEAPEVPVAAAPVAAPVAWTIDTCAAPEAEAPAPLEERPAHEHQRDGVAKGIAWVV